MFPKSVSVTPVISLKRSFRYCVLWVGHQENKPLLTWISSSVSPTAIGSKFKIGRSPWRNTTVLSFQSVSTGTTSDRLRSSGIYAQFSGCLYLKALLQNASFAFPPDKLCFPQSSCLSEVEYRTLLSNWNRQWFVPCGRVTVWRDRNPLFSNALNFGYV